MKKKFILYLLILFFINKNYAFNQYYNDMNNDNINDCISTSVKFIYKNKISKLRVSVIEKGKNRRYKKKIFNLKYYSSNLSNTQILDLNNDGKKEVICSVYYMNPDNHGYLGKSSLRIFTYDYEKKDIVKVWEKYYNADQVAFNISDFDKDGNKEIALVKANNKEEKDFSIIQYKNNQVYETEIDMNMELSERSKVEIKDVNNDELDDIYVYNYEFDDLNKYFLINNGKLNFEKVDVTKYFYMKFGESSVAIYEKGIKRLTIKGKQKENGLKSDIKKIEDGTVDLKGFDRCNENSKIEFKYGKNLMKTDSDTFELKIIKENGKYSLKKIKVE